MSEATNDELHRQIRAYEATVHNMQLKLDEAIAERDALRLELEAVGAGGVQSLTQQKPMGTSVGQADAAIKNAAPQQEVQEPVHPACKSDMIVNSGALKLALNVPRRAGKTEVADELEKTAQPTPSIGAEGVAYAGLQHTLWVLAEHNALHFGENHSTVMQARQALAALRTQQEVLPLLAAEHSGFRVDYSELLGQCQRALRGREPVQAELLRQLQGHLQELGQRWYAGDTAVVDEILQLYCIEARARLGEGGA